MTPTGQLSSQYRLLNSVGKPCILARVQQNNFSEIPVSEEVNKHTDSKELKAKLCGCKEKNGKYNCGSFYSSICAAIATNKKSL